MPPNDDVEEGATMMEESDTNMSDSVNDRDGDATMDSNDKSNDDDKEHPKEKTIEEQYQKLEQIEHVLKRPDTYSK